MLLTFPVLDYQDATWLLVLSDAETGRHPLSWFPKEVCQAYEGSDGQDALGTEKYIYIFF